VIKRCYKKSRDKSKRRNPLVSNLRRFKHTRHQTDTKHKCCSKTWTKNAAQGAGETTAPLIFLSHEYYRATVVLWLPPHSPTPAPATPPTPPLTPPAAIKVNAKTKRRTFRYRTYDVFEERQTSGHTWTVFCPIIPSLKFS
jgi:hypothetical protein